jgi:hypothetical protein
MDAFFLAGSIARRAVVRPYRAQLCAEVFGSVDAVVHKAFLETFKW